MTAPPLALGVDLGGTKIEARLYDAAGRERWRQRVATPGAGYDATVQAVATLVGAAAEAAAGAPFTIGIGTPGSATPDGRMKNCNSTLLNGRRLAHDLQHAIGQPIRMANDANCLALSEATDGAAAGADVVFAIIAGTGLGAGIVVRGHVLTGPNGLAGEWGHNPLPWADAAADPVFTCYCGQRGCLETLLSGSGMARDHAHVTGLHRSGQAIVAAAAGGDAAARATLDRHADRMARALAMVINLLDPDVIVLGGGLSQLDHLYHAVPARWARWVVSGGLADPVRTRLVRSQHGDASGARGAALLWQSAGGLTG